MINIFHCPPVMKEEILQTSLQQFLRYGIREMSIQKLIKPLGISTKTVYKYFKNKEELLEEALYLFHTQQYRLLETPQVEQSAACLFFDLWLAGVEQEFQVNKLFFEDLHGYYPELAKKVENAIGQKFTQQFLLLLHRGIDEGTFRPDILPEVVLQGIFTLYTALVRTERFKSFGLSAHAALLNTIALYIRGFCTDKGLQQLEEHLASLGISDSANANGKRRVQML